jgi:hypothetical protein
MTTEAEAAPTHDEFKQRLEQLFEIDRLVRSHIIYEAISIEGIIDQIIAWHFCPDEAKHVWFQSLLFREGEVGFSKKIRILKKLLRDCYPDLFEKVPGLINKLDDIRDLRNKFAHSELVLDENKVREADGKGVFLESVKDGKVDQEFVSIERANKIVNDNSHFRFLMIVIWLEIQNRAQDKNDGKLVDLLGDLAKKLPDVLARVKE